MLVFNRKEYHHFEMGSLHGMTFGVHTLGVQTIVACSFQVIQTSLFLMLNTLNTENALLTITRGGGNTESVSSPRDPVAAMVVTDTMTCDRS